MQEETRIRQQPKNGKVVPRKDWSIEHAGKLNCSSTTKAESLRASPDVALHKSEIKASLEWVREARKSKLSGECPEKRRTHVVIDSKAEPIRVPLHLKNITLFDEIRHKGHYLRKRKYSNKTSFRNLPRILIEKTVNSLYESIV